MNEPTLTIYGAGHLGLLVAKSYRKLFPTATIYGITRTTKNHESLKSLNIVPLICYNNTVQTSNVIVAVPPQEEYLTILSNAKSTWNRSGNFLLISSTRVYGEHSGKEVVENSPVNTDSLLYQAEDFALKAEGMVLRLAGLYDQTKGPHKKNQEKRKIASQPESFLNLIHTQDASDLVVQCLLYGLSQNIYLGCDGNPISRRHFADISFGKTTDLEFTMSDDLGKKCNNEWTKKVLSWNPRYKSFEEWLQQEEI